MSYAQNHPEENSPKSSSVQNRFYKDPIHHEIDFDHVPSWLYDLTKTPELRRLSFIKQLGVTDEIFPGATATRFGHSLGTYEVARRFLFNIRSLASAAAREKITTKKVNTVLAAALLHDLGHGPTSHLFEECVNDLNDDHVATNEKFNHENFSKKLILNPHGRVNQILRKHNMEPQRIADLLFGVNHITDNPVWMQQLVSSELDADRIDYLLRDSHYTGANYGIIDLQLLIKWARFDEENERIYYQHGAVALLENFLISRYHMYKNVYSNPKERTFAWQLKVIFALLKDRIQHQKISLDDSLFANDIGKLFRNTIYKILIEHNLNAIEPNDYLLLNDYSLYAFINLLKNCNDKLLSAFASAYVSGESYFKTAWFGTLEELNKAYEERKANYEKTLKRDARFLLHKVVPNIIKIYAPECDSKRIWIESKAGIEDLTEHSSIIKLITAHEINDRSRFYLIYSENIF